MTGLRDDLNAALAAMSRTAETPLALDAAGWCAVPVPMPPSVIRLREGHLPVAVQLSDGETRFRLSTPLAIFESAPDAATLDALLRQQCQAEDTAGNSYAIVERDGHTVLLAVYHWALPAIEAAQFRALFKAFVAAAFEQIEVIKALLADEPGAVPVHPGRDAAGQTA